MKLPDRAVFAGRRALDYDTGGVFWDPETD